jgi:hypothetical protein
MGMTHLKDLGERSIATMAQVFIATWTVGDMAGAKVAAGLAVVKGFLAKRFGDPNSASLMR